MSNESEQIRRLEALVNKLAGRIAAMEDPCGRMFVADLSNPGSVQRAFVEMIPKADGSELQVLTEGRTVSGSSDASVFLAIPSLKSGQGLMMGFALGQNTAYVRVSEQLRYGKIQTVGVCNAYSVVKECNSNGDLLSNLLVTVLPVVGACANTSGGFCLNVGDIIAYMVDPEEPTTGAQVAAYKGISVSYICTTTSTANVPDLNRLGFYNGDFTLIASSDCGDESNLQNVGAVYWDGNTILPYSHSPVYSHVKVWDLDIGVTPPSGTPGTDYSDIPIVVKSSGTTSAHVPTVGGSPCADASGPQYVKLAVRAKVATVVLSVDGAHCNEDGTITVSTTTGRALVPI